MTERDTQNTRLQMYEEGMRVVSGLCLWKFAAIFCADLGIKTSVLA
jgi:hypothetical protein